jgi:hypothetical protein
VLHNIHIDFLKKLFFAFTVLAIFANLKGIAQWQGTNQTIITSYCEKSKKLF